MQFAIRFGLVAALLTLVQSAYAFRVAVTATSCASMTFTLTLTPAEIAGAAGLGVYPSLPASPDNEIAEVDFNGAFATVNSYSYAAGFFGGFTQTSGTKTIVFRLIDGQSNVLTAFPPVSQQITFQCGTVLNTPLASAGGTATQTSAAAGSSATGTTDNGSGSTNSNSGSNTNGSSNNGNASANSGSSSGSSSNTGAIAGGVAGGAAAHIALALVAFGLKKKKKNKRAQQSRLRNDEADEAAFRAPNNNDSTASLATAPENADTPMMRDISTKNVFADPTTSATSGAPSGSSGAFSGSNVAAAGAGAAAGGIGAAAIAARKHSREQSRARSPSNLSERRPSSEFSKDNTTPMSQNPPPVPALPSNAASLPAKRTPSPPTSAPQASSPLSNTASSAAPAAAAGAAATTAAAAVAASKAGSNDKDNKAKTSKWGFGKRASKDESATTKLPYPSAVPEPISSPESESEVAAAPTSSPKKAVQTPSSPASPTRSFNVIQKQPAAVPTSTAGPSSASIAPSERSLNRPPVFPSRSGPGTPAGSIRGNNYSRAPSVASMSAGFTDAAPPLPSGAASVASMPTSEFGGNMAGVGAGRSFAASSGNSTKWHQQSYNIMPNFTQRALARSTQLDEDLIFGHLGMGLTPPAPGPGLAGNGSETGSSKSRTDPFGDR